MKIGADGLPLISYWDGVHADLKLAHCSNVTCSASTLFVVDGGPDFTGLYSSVAVAPTDYAIISYREEVSGTLKVAFTRADHDGDGCGDATEQGSVASQGGLRNPKYFWDFYDVWGRPDPIGQPTLWVRDRAINVVGDILGVARRFGSARPGGAPTLAQALSEALTTPTSETGYHADYDRGLQIGPNAWNLAGPDGGINVVDDLLGVARQFGHTCV